MHSISQLPRPWHPATVLSSTPALVPLPAPQSAVGIAAVVAAPGAHQATAAAAAASRMLPHSSRRSAAIPLGTRWRLGRRIAWCAAAGMTTSGRTPGLVPACACEWRCSRGSATIQCRLEDIPPTQCRRWSCVPQQAQVAGAALRRAHERCAAELAGGGAGGDPQPVLWPRGAARLQGA